MPIILAVTLAAKSATADTGHINHGFALEGVLEVFLLIAVVVCDCLRISHLCAFQGMGECC